MAKYRTKPIVIEAYELTAGTIWDANVPRWLEDAAMTGLLPPRRVGDYVIRCADGKLYVCKPDMFAAMYELEAVMRDIKAGVGLPPVKRIIENHVRKRMGLPPSTHIDMPEASGQQLLDRIREVSIHYEEQTSKRPERITLPTDQRVLLGAWIEAVYTNRPPMGWSRVGELRWRGVLIEAEVVPAEQAKNQENNDG